MRYLILSLTLAASVSATPRPHHYRVDGADVVEHHQGWNCQATHGADWRAYPDRPKDIRPGLVGLRTLGLGPVDYLDDPEPNPLHVSPEETPDEAPTMRVWKQRPGVVMRPAAFATLASIGTDQEWRDGAIRDRTDKMARRRGRKARRVLAKRRELGLAQRDLDDIQALAPETGALGPLRDRQEAMAAAAVASIQAEIDALEQ